MSTKAIVFSGTAYSCPYRDVLPALTQDERSQLRADIEKNGVLVPIVITDQAEILDGHNRLEIAVELGLPTVPFEIVAGLTPDEKRVRAEDLNLLRRHLTPEQRRAVIDRRLKADPAQSDSSIAASLGVSDKTVGARRKRLESTSEIPMLTSVRGRDGKTHPRHRSRPITPTPSASGDPTPLPGSPATALRSSDFQMIVYELGACIKAARRLARSKPKRTPAEVDKLTRMLISITNRLRQGVANG
jgi:hypothetical protein